MEHLSLQGRTCYPGVSGLSIWPAAVNAGLATAAAKDLSLIDYFFRLVSSSKSLQKKGEGKRQAVMFLTSEVGDF